MYRFLLLGLFVVGFVGAVASADKESVTTPERSLSSLIQDVKTVNEADAINSGRWNINQDDNSKTLDSIAELFAKEDSLLTVSK